MKKILFLVAAALTMTACGNDDNYIDQPVAAQISATISNSAVSRASQTNWDRGDSIGITMTGNLVSYVNQKYTADTEEGSFTGPAMYFKNHIDPLSLTAYYPYTGSEGTQPTVIEASTTSDNQTADKQPEFDFLYASLNGVTGSNPNVTFTFSHRMSKLTLIFKNGNDGTDVSKITSYQIDGLILDGTFNTVTGVCAVNPESETEALTMATTSVESGKELPSLIIFPQPTADKTVTLKIKDSENQDYKCQLKFNDGLVSGNNYLFTVTVSKTEISINNPEIADWHPEEIELKDDDAAISDDDD